MMNFLHWLCMTSFTNTSGALKSKVSVSPPSSPGSTVSAASTPPRMGRSNSKFRLPFTHTFSITKGFCPVKITSRTCNLLATPSTYTGLSSRPRWKWLATSPNRSTFGRTPPCCSILGEKWLTTGYAYFRLRPNYLAPTSTEITLV